MRDAELKHAAEKLGAMLLERGWSVTTAESCTGGWIAKVLTDVAGSSQWFMRGFVTYSNEAKVDMIGVPEAVLAEHGAVSEAVVEAMANGAASQAGAELAVAVSGIAGPGGDVPGKPVGTVWVAWRSPARTQTHEFRFDGDRESVRRQSVAAALEGLIRAVRTSG